MSSKRITQEQLVAILKSHVAWVSGKGGERADLSGADLSCMDLSGAYLSRANLSGADMSRADLSWANLSKADLSRTNLFGTNLFWTNLSGADMSGASVTWAFLYCANLSRVQSPLALAVTEILPREGEVIGWKKCRDGVLVKLRVPPDARRSNATSRKCRAERVEVLEVVGAPYGVSLRNGMTIYHPGHVVKANAWDENRMQECAGGIHFFLTREEAEAFTL